MPPQRRQRERVGGEGCEVQGQPARAAEHDPALEDGEDQIGEEEVGAGAAGGGDPDGDGRDIEQAPELPDPEALGELVGQPPQQEAQRTGGGRGAGQRGSVERALQRGMAREQGVEQEEAQDAARLCQSRTHDAPSKNSEAGTKLGRDVEAVPGGSRRRLDRGSAGLPLERSGVGGRRRFRRHRTSRAVRPFSNAAPSMGPSVGGSMHGVVS